MVICVNSLSSFFEFLNVLCQKNMFAIRSFKLFLDHNKSHLGSTLIEPETKCYYFVTADLYYSTLPFVALSFIR